MTTSRRSDGYLSCRMQGTSRLNLTEVDHDLFAEVDDHLYAEVDDDLFAELELLTARAGHAAQAARSSGFPTAGTNS